MINVLVTEEDLALGLAQDQVVAKICAEKFGGTGNEEAGGSLDEWGPGQFTDSGSTAIDMLSITEALGQETVNYLGIMSDRLFHSFFCSLCSRLRY